MGSHSQRRRRRSRNPDLDQGNPDFPEFFFRFFLLLRTSWDLRVTPRMFRYHLIRIRTGKYGFSKIQIFGFFDFLSLKTLQRGNILQVQCNMLSRGPLVLYIIIISEREPDTFCSFKFLFKQIFGARIYTIISILSPQSRSEQRRHTFAFVRSAKVACIDLASQHKQKRKTALLVQ